MQPATAPLTAECTRPNDPLHGRIFTCRDDAVAAWIDFAGQLEEREVWLTPTESFKVKLPLTRPPKFIPFKLLRVKGTNQFIARPMNWPWLVRFHQAQHFLGENFSKKVISRLGEAGFVRVCKLTPQVHLLDLETLYEHMLATTGEAAATFWNDRRRQLYHEAAAFVR